MEELAFAYTKLIQEGTNFIMFLILLFTTAHKETLIKPKLMDTLKGLAKYLSSSLVNILGFYGDMISFEFNTYMAALLHNVNQIDVWVTFINYSALYYFTSIGISFAVRNLIGNEIGKGQIKKARQNSKAYFFYIFLISLFLMVLSNIYKKNIAMLYTRNEII